MEQVKHSDYNTLSENVTLIVSNKFRLDNFANGVENLTVKPFKKCYINDKIKTYSNLNFSAKLIVGGQLVLETTNPKENTEHCIFKDFLPVFDSHDRNVELHCENDNGFKNDYLFEITFTNYNRINDTIKTLCKFENVIVEFDYEMLKVVSNADGTKVGSDLTPIYNVPIVKTTRIIKKDMNQFSNPLFWKDNKIFFELPGTVFRITHDNDVKIYEKNSKKTVLLNQTLFYDMEHFTRWYIQVENTNNLFIEYFETSAYFHREK